MNKICAIDITGKVVNLLLIEGTKAEYKVLESKPLKIELKDHTDSNSIKTFAKNIDDFFNDYSIVNVAIKSGSTGMYKSGPAVFKMEAIVQMTNANIQYVKPQTLTAFWKKNDIDIESHNLKKYQHNAFKLAYYFLEDK